MPSKDKAPIAISSSPPSPERDREVRDVVASNLSAVHDGGSRIPSVDQPALRHPSKTGVSYETVFRRDPTPNLYLIKVTLRRFSKSPPTWMPHG